MNLRQDRVHQHFRTPNHVLVRDERPARRYNTSQDGHGRERVFRRQHVLVDDGEDDENCQRGSEEEHGFSERKGRSVDVTVDSRVSFLKTNSPHFAITVRSGDVKLDMYFDAGT